MKEAVWAHRYGMSESRLLETLDMTPEEAEKIHQRFLDQWHKDAKVRESLFFKRLPEAKDSFQKMTPEFWASRLEPPYVETMKPWSWDIPGITVVRTGRLSCTWRDPLAITAVAKAVGTLAIDLVKHKRMG